MTWTRASQKDYHPISLAVPILITFLAGCTGQPTPPTQPETAKPRPGIIFTSDRSGNWDIFIIQPDGSSLTHSRMIQQLMQTLIGLRMDVRLLSAPGGMAAQIYS